MTSVRQGETRADDDAPPEGARPRRGLHASRRRVLWHVAALAIYGLALTTPFHEVWREDLSVVAPMYPRFEPPLSEQQSFWKWIGESEQRFVAWQVSRNARVLLAEPGRLFDTEQCYPTPEVMALGEPMIALGAVGAPFWLLTGDPLLTYNAVLAGAILLAALAMYWLVSDWTGSQPAGVAAGLLYAFHPDKLGDINHYYIHDTAWTVLALLFARRFFARGRWLDALALALCCAMQMAGSFYPFVSATLLAGPILVWLGAHYGWRNLPPAPTLAAGLLVGAAGYWIFSPYLAMHAGELLATRSELHFASGSELLPGGGRFPGWIALLLMAGAFAPGRERGLASGMGNPRWALLAGAALVGAMAISGSSPEQMPPLYRVLSSLLPGLDAIRRPNEILSGLHICLSILAGLGAAALLARLPAHRATLGAGLLVALVFVFTVRPAWLGLEPPVRYRALPMRPADPELAFFESLARGGNTGPLLEVPRGGIFLEAHRVLLTGYHRRRSSACVNALAPQTAEVWDLAERLPDPAALAQLHAMGFTTLLAHHPARLEGGAADALAERIHAASRQPGSPLRRIHGIDSMTAYEIRLPTGRSAAPVDP
ncbi:MAG: hypothetical protein JRG96_02695 [Deltaproteobacteria bacterium]|nr:hypothetical protein [Deltaproteobacteria bacterium]MBW2419416.1 hypothetical protein [Deltaproteobacteria bacterium]